MDTERLRLRRWREEDIAPFAALNADPEVMEYFPACLTEEETRGLVGRMEGKFEKNGFGLWAVETKNSGAFIGFVGLNTPDFEARFTPCVEIGWRLARAHWGKGYATEAAKVALNYAFHTAKLPEVLSWTYEGNTKSRQVMERLGMQRDTSRDFLHPALPDGHRLRPHVMYCMEKPA